MTVASKAKNQFSVKAYSGDNKTLLAFDFDDAALAKNLAGFTIACKLPGTQPAFYLFNFLQFQNPGKHAQVAGELPTSTVNAPIQKYRWVDFAHAPKNGGSLVAGNYTYTVTPRYFDANASMLAIDTTKSVSVTIPVGPFVSGALKLGFTRGYMQSQAYARDFGGNTPIEPANRPLQYSTAAKAGTNKAGKDVTFIEIYDWMGATARVQIFDVLDQVVKDPALHLDVFAYDLNEPDLVAAFLTLAALGRIRIILDSAQLHITHQETNKKTGTTKTVVPLEEDFAQAFAKVAKDPAALKRGCFDRFSHDKIFIVSSNGVASSVLTGATNFSVNGLYVNANHVLVFDQATVAQYYAKVFEESWTVLTSPKVSKAIAAAFAGSPLATKAFVSSTPNVPKMTINVSPHTVADTTRILNAIQKRITSEASASNGNVIFAVMQLTRTQSPVCQTLINLHNTQSLFSYGISDSPGGVKLYAPGSKTGVLVTGKPSQVVLPPPFDRVPAPPGHEIHDKFVVCGVNGKDPVVWCGSSNLATGGEESNGDNLLEIHDADVAMTFAIEALLLVDHYNFLDRFATPPKATAPKAPMTPKSVAKKALAANSATKRTAPRKAAGKKPVARKAALKKRTAKKAAVKKTATKRTSARSASLRISTPMAPMMAPAKKGVAKKAVRKPVTKAAKSSGRRPEVTEIPQSLDKAATKAGMFLYTNDAWSLRYFDPNDLHSLERKLFG
jgi:PLD-like domain